MDLLKAMKQAQAAIGLSNAMFGQPVTPASVDTTGFAKRSKDLLLSNVRQSGAGFIGNKYVDLAQSSDAVMQSLGYGNGTPQGWLLNKQDGRYHMAPQVVNVPYQGTTTLPPEQIIPYANKTHSNIDIGTDEAFARYMSTIGVSEANKLKNPLAYQQAQKDFAKRVNIKPLEYLTNK